MRPGLDRVRWIALAPLAVALLGGCATSEMWTPSREQVLQRILPSAVQIVVEQKDGRRVRAGSGVVLATRRADPRLDCFVLTSGHTVSGLVGRSEIYVVLGRYGGSVQKLPATILAHRDGPEVDLALLQTEAARCDPARAGGAPLLGESVWVVGFPWGRRMTLTSGIVSQVGLDDDVDGEAAPRLMVDAQVSYGSSGGGVYEARGGRLIGLVEGYSTARVTPEGANPTWYIDVPVPGQTLVTPLSDVKRFLSDAGYGDLIGVPDAARLDGAGERRRSSSR
jgi:S1-C subfamily serine protease